MNNYSDLGSKKYLIITFMVLAGFFLLILNAYNNLSDSQSEVNKNPNAVDVNQLMANMAAENQQQEAANQAQEEQYNNEQPNKGLNVDIQSSVNATEELKPIDENEQISNQQVPEAMQEEKTDLSADQELELQFLNARKCKEEKQLQKALEEYKAIADSSTNMDVKARCYEEMADIYGIAKRYGSALSYAQRAYNIAPTTAREVLIARLYYKTGEIDKATKRINNVLQRDFANDR